MPGTARDATVGFARRRRICLRSSRGSVWEQDGKAGIRFHGGMERDFFLFAAVRERKREPLALVGNGIVGNWSRAGKQKKMWSGTARDTPPSGNGMAAIIKHTTSVVLHCRMRLCVRPTWRHTRTRILGNLVRFCVCWQLGCTLQ